MHKVQCGLKDMYGGVIRRIIKPEGFKSVDGLLDQVRRGIVDVKQWGYSNTDRLAEAIGNIY